MAVPEALLNEARRAMDELSGRAKREFLTMWQSAPNQARLIDVLDEWFPALVEKYGTVAASVGAEVFALEAEALGITAHVQVAGVDHTRAVRGGRWAAAKPNPSGNLVLALDMLVRQPYRSTLQGSAWASGVAWCRVPRGRDTCAFCLMLASRGAVYRTITAAGGDGNKYHGGCSCEPVVVRGREDYPRGYDPDGLYDMYDAAVAAVEGPHSTKAVLAEMRRMHDLDR